MTAVKKIMQNDSTFEVSARWAEGLASNKIMTCDICDPSQGLDLLLNKGIQHIIQTQSPYSAKDINTAALMTSQCELFFKSPAMAILHPDKFEPQLEKFQYKYLATFDKIKDKKHVLSGVDESLSEIGVGSSIKADALLALDELFTNAVFNAPTMDLENTRPGFSRDQQDAAMPAGSTGRVFVSCDESRFVIGCQDPFGTLNPTKLLSRIKSCYDTGVAANIRLKEEGGGAGIGSFLVFNVSASYYLAVSENQTSLICFSMPIKMSNRMRAELPKNIHYIYIK